MGTGYALYCAAGEGKKIVAIAARLGFSAMLAGRVEDGPREVVLEPVGVRFAGDQFELSVEQS
jgi:phosphoribosylformylglycinamidine cyclo-ligase